MGGFPSTFPATLALSAGAFPNVAGVTYVPLVGANLVITGSGHNDIYTVPAGRKAYVGPVIRAYNPSGGTIAASVELKVSSTYYRVSADLSLSTVTGGSLTLTGGLVLSAGESISIKCATTAGLNVRGDILEFDASVTSLATARILTLGNGDNTLLTVPAGKQILPVAFTNSAVTANASVVVLNSSGGSLNYYVNQVPSGGSVGSTNQLYPATAVGDAAAGTFLVGVMAAGDVLNINTSAGTATQTAWFTYYQIP